METIKVNMNPCEDVQTIHASQNDTEARQWEFELHNNGELIDTSEVTDQMVFKAYKGGTEQILPENTSTPTTSPFLGDIKYPQGLLTDQEFLYRESPTEEDGLAKITDIKGNTLVWNQIFIPYGRTSNGIQSNVIQDGNDYSIRIYGTATASAWLRMDSIGVLPVGHKFLLDKGSTSDLFDINNDNNGLNVDFSVKTKIGTVTTANKYIYIFVASGTTIDVTVKPMLIDLTQMGLDSITSVEEFTSLFSLPYYAYNQGTLLSFNGNGIKTVGKNQLDPSDAVGLIGTVTYSNDTYTITYSSSGDRYVGMNFYRRGIPLDKLLPKKYTLSFDISGVSTTWAIGLRNATNNSFLNSAVVSVNSDGHYSLTIDLETNNQTEYYLSFVRTGNQTSALTVLISNVMLEIGNAETSYEPYTSSTLSLSISTYFPNGMKSAGSVYDELTESKAITRLKKVTYSSSTEWSMRTTGSGWNLFEITPSDIKHVGTPPNETIKNNRFNWNRGLTDNNTIRQVNQIISVRKDDITSLSDWNTYLASNPLEVIYELATSTETSFTTASLVTENAEIPLSNEDGILIGKCTEQLSENPGFFDAKIKLSDSDGECYSNKIQLHVERSPQ